MYVVKAKSIVVYMLIFRHLKYVFMNLTLIPQFLKKIASSYRCCPPPTHKQSFSWCRKVAMR